jgi:hypothetical protein
VKLTVTFTGFVSKLDEVKFEKGNPVMIPFEITVQKQPTVRLIAPAARPDATQTPPDPDEHPRPPLPRPARLVTLPGGGAVHVRDLTVAELRRIDARAEEVAGPPERQVRTALLIAATALADPDGRPLFPDRAGDLAELADGRRADTRPARAVCEAAVRTKDAAKN